MQYPSNGSGRRPTSHPFAPHEATLRSLFQSSPPSSIDAPEVRALLKTAHDAATRICRRIRFEPCAEQATLAVHVWQRELQQKIPESYDSSRPFFAYTYRALTFIIYRLARESGLWDDPEMKSAAAAAEPAAHGNDPAYLAQLSELPELVATLPESLRITIIMRFFDGRTTKEIAAILKITPNAARLRIHRAMTLFRCLFDLS